MIRGRRIAFLAAAIAIAANGGKAAAPPDSSQETDTASPVKRVEEPVFQLPELVIIGENQVRIMAQREKFAASPMQTLGEAPLLEKEEAAVAGIRERVPILPVGEIAEGAEGLAKLELGSPGWGGASFWVGRQTWRSHRSLAIFGSQLQGSDRPGDTAGGRDLGLTLGAGFTGREDTGGREDSGWLARMGSVFWPESGAASFGWRRMSRDLRYATQGSQRHFDRLFISGQGRRGSSGFTGLGQASYVRLRIPGGALAAGSCMVSTSMPVLRTERLAVRVDPRLAMETAEVAGDHTQLGADMAAAWIPGGRWRFLLGMVWDGVWGSGETESMFSPQGGVSWRSPWGPTFSAEIRPSLNMPFMSGLAHEIPYSYFVSPPIPERETLNLSVGALQKRWDGSEAGLEYRLRKIRDALSWAVLPGTGLWLPAEVGRLNVHELGLRLKMVGSLPVSIFASGVWRSISTEGGEIANLPHAKGSFGAEYGRRPLALRIELEAVGDRPGSFMNAAGDLSGYQDLRFTGSYEAAGWITFYMQGGNLLGQTIEFWRGYPEPKHFITLGAQVSF